ncbi:MAG: gamma-glutamyltransferase [Myxococcales bacterium]|nr:gamma-glutamyltransferase [Myxococcota bacterium]MDW8283739.1 gamma-glutamyltransferase [Myxococcales bacterium]
MNWQTCCPHSISVVARTLLWALLVVRTPLARAAYPAPLEGTGGAVAADHELASRAGAAVLERGGNAVDAAVATALALGVVQPAGSGLGGGGFLVFRSRAGAVHVLDFREVAPRRAHRDMFLDEKTGRPVAERSRIGGLAVAVPGEPAGLGEALRRLGTQQPAQVIAPALALARDGFPVGPHLARTAERVVHKLPPGHPLRALLAPGGKPLAVGQHLRRPELARTLARLAERGFSAFYDTAPGGIGAEIVRAVQQAGGIIEAQDLASYQPLWRTPLVGTFRGWRVYTNPPPGGGLTTLEALQVLDAAPPLLGGPGASSTLHMLAEAFKHAFADRARLLGDPAFVKVPTEELASADYARRLAQRLRDDGILPAAHYGRQGGPAESPRDHGTSHLCVIDAEGNAAALTTTINLEFGARLVAGTTGVLLNNQMDDFSASPGEPNAFGLVGSEANAVAGGKRPLSSMSPLIAVAPDGRILCAGASGGPTIVTGTVQAVVAVIAFGQDVQRAVSAPRIHAQFVPDKIFVEGDIPVDVQDGLRRRGHSLVVTRGPGEAAVQAVLWEPRKEGPARVSAASDPRKGGLPALAAARPR